MIRVQAVTFDAPGGSAPRILSAARLKVLHLECGHEFTIAEDAVNPEKFECRYCIRVPTIEEMPNS